MFERTLGRVVAVAHVEYDVIAGAAGVGDSWCAGAASARGTGEGMVKISMWSDETFGIGCGEARSGELFGTFIPVVFLITLFIQSEARKAAESGSEGNKF